MSDMAKLVKFEVNNMMCIRFAEVEFKEGGEVVVVGGQNGSGKSSLLQSLQFAFGGKKAVDKPPLKDGADVGSVNVELGGNQYTIRRTINQKGSETLTVKGADGKPIRQPQKVLNELMGTMGIDPSIIWGMKTAEVSKKLRDAMGLDLSDLDATEKSATDERSLAKKELARAETEVTLTTLNDDTPDEKVSASSLLDQIGAGEKLNGEIEAAKKSITENTNHINDNAAQILELQDEIRSLTEQSAKLQSSIDETAEFVQSVDPVDVSELRVQLSSIEEINRRVDENQKYRAACERVELARADVNSKNEAVKAVRQEKLDRVAQAKFPLDGVEFDRDGQLILDGKPWGAWSDGERLLAAFEIAAAMSPGINAVVMRQGSLFDDEAKQVIAEVAQDRGYLVLMEVVGDSEDVMIYMDDGQLKDRRG